MKATGYSIVALTCVPAITCSLTHADLTPSETRQFAIELGATPDTLTAAGFTLSTTQQALDRLAAQEQAAAAMRQQRTLVASLQSQIKSLNAQAGAATEMTDLQRIESESTAARADLATAVGLAESARSQLIAALVGPAVVLELAERVFSPPPLPPV